MDFKEIETDDEVNRGQAEPELPELVQKKLKRLLKQEKLKDLKKKNNRGRKHKKSNGDPKQVTKTINNNRKQDSTVLYSDNEKKKKNLTTENSNVYYNEFKNSDPKVLITFDNSNPQMKVRKLAKMLTKLVPNSDRIFHRYTSIKKTVQAAIVKGYIYLIILKEDNRFVSEPNGLIIANLANGTKAKFILSDVEFPKKMQLKEFTNQKRKVNILNFTTKSDEVLAHMLSAVFHQEAEFKARHIVTIHKQRNDIFFQHHKYIILNNKPSFKELGPKFRLRLIGKI